MEREKERGRTIHRKEEPSFGRHVFGQGLCVVCDRVEREGAHARWEFRVPFAIRNADRTLKGDLERLVSSHDTDNVLGFA